MALPLPANEWTLEQIKANGRDHAAYAWNAKPKWHEWNKEQIRAYLEAYYERSDEIRTQKHDTLRKRNIDAIIEDGGKRMFWNGISE